MTTEERERMFRLVQQIQIEKDQTKFIELVKELNALLGEKDRLLDHLPD